MVMQSSISRLAVMAAVIAGVAAGSYGIASAASGSNSSGQSSSAAQSQSAQRGWGGQRSDETLLTGETASRVEAAALAKVSGSTVVRVETDADGNAAYEAHMTEADGTAVTVYVNEAFEVVSVESR
jgi:uncharacterized membrane protein YkoI